MDFWGWLTEGWNAFTSWVSDAWDWVTGAATTVVNAIADAVTWVVDGIGDAVNWVIDAAGTAVNWVVEGIETVAETILPFAQPFIEGVSDAVQGAVTAVTDTVSTIAELATDTVSAVVDGVASVVTTGISIVHDFGENFFSDPIGAIATAVTDVVEGIAGLFPDPSQPDNPGWSFFTHIYDTLAKTLIEFPDKLTENIPFLNYVGDIVSNVVSFVLKDVGIVADHFLMWGGQAVNVVENLVVGAVNIGEKLFKDPASIWSDGDSSGSPDSVMDVINNIYSYALNSTSHHLVHDVELLASPIDLLIQLAKTTEEALGIDLPGLSEVDDAWDWAVTSVQGGLVSVVDGAGQLGEWIGLDRNDHGSGSHHDHVGEGNIRGEHALDHSGHTDTSTPHGGDNGSHQDGNEGWEYADQVNVGGQGAHVVDQGEIGNHGEHVADHGEPGTHGENAVEQGEHGEHVVDQDGHGELAGSQLPTGQVENPGPATTVNPEVPAIQPPSAVGDQHANGTHACSIGSETAVVTADSVTDIAGSDQASMAPAVDASHVSPELTAAQIWSETAIVTIDSVVNDEAEGEQALDMPAGEVGVPVQTLPFEYDNNHVPELVFDHIASDDASMTSTAQTDGAANDVGIPVQTLPFELGTHHIAPEFVFERVEGGDAALISAIEDLGPIEDIDESDAKDSKAANDYMYYAPSNAGPVIDFASTMVC